MTGEITGPVSGNEQELFEGMYWSNIGSQGRSDRLSATRILLLNKFDQDKSLPHRHTYSDTVSLV